MFFNPDSEKYTKTDEITQIDLADPDMPYYTSHSIDVPIVTYHYPDEPFSISTFLFNLFDKIQHVGDPISKFLCMCSCARVMCVLSACGIDDKIADNCFNNTCNCCN